MDSDIKQVLPLLSLSIVLALSQRQKSQILFINLARLDEDVIHPSSALLFAVPISHDSLTIVLPSEPLTDILVAICKYLVSPALPEVFEEVAVVFATRRVGEHTLPMELAFLPIPVIDTPLRIYLATAPVTKTFMVVALIQVASCGDLSDFAVLQARRVSFSFKYSTFKQTLCRMLEFFLFTIVLRCWQPLKGSLSSLSLNHPDPLLKKGLWIVVGTVDDLHFILELIILDDVHASAVGMHLDNGNNVTCSCILCIAFALDGHFLEVKSLLHFPGFYVENDPVG